MTDADLRYAVVTGANFYYTVWSNTRWVDGEYYDSKPPLMATNCELIPYGNCAGADLSHMDLSGMNLKGINLRGANLENTSFENSSLFGADLI